MTRPVAALLSVALFVAGAAAQSPTVYKARLGVTPVDANNQPVVTGSGSVTATLKGTVLVIDGTFTGLHSPATSARVHVGPRGIRGPAVLDLTVTKARAGTITGALTLTEAQLEHLRRSRLYIQINSEEAADGNLWGWLLP
ncbi:MAG: CHRD domain-containing protein [Vicinamibacterales bacterium]|jgi:hypothetical protein